ncbi:SHD1 domain-containing protein [Aeoliella sp.]|uniref:SHD1 domain-containing protein n=1 Tax=Aeoliella sp. TaxID=2795800 RepID=UPI003CCBD46B
MSKTTLLLTTLVLLAWGCTALTSSVLGRTWTDRSGKHKVEAELVTVRKGNAYLEIPSGDVKKISLEKLSVADLRHIASLPQYSDQVTPLLPADVTAPEPSPTKKMAEIRTHLESGSVRQLRSGSWGYKGLVFSDDGAHLLLLGSDNITVYDIDASKAEVHKIDHDVATRESLALSPDGKQLFAGNRDGEVLIWRFEYAKLSPQSRLAIYEDPVVAISVSPDGKRAITGHSREVACLWDVETGKVLGSYNDFRLRDSATALFSRQGGQALITDGGVLALVDVESAKLLQVMHLCDYPASVHSAALTSDGSRIAICEGGAITVWETRSGKRLPEIPVDEIQWSAQFSTNGKLLITGGSELVSIWDLENGRLAHEFKMQESGYVQHVAVSPDGLHIAAIGAPIGSLVEVFRLPPALTK